LSTEPLSHRIYDPPDWSSLPLNGEHEAAARLQRQRPAAGGKRMLPRLEEHFPSWLRPYLAARAGGKIRTWGDLSRWSQSPAKRFFDCACVVASFPVLVPLLLAIGAAVRFTSRGPVLFLQERVGRNGQSFKILKFRTMIHVTKVSHHPITTSDNQRFTPVGPFLRRWKLDELPQLANVLLGHMSLVGPRPKLREHVTFDPPCRPGITGLATIVFAREEKILSCVARERLDDYFHSVVLPAKRELDAAYMARATFLSDFRLLIDSALRRWDTAALDELIALTTFGAIEETLPSRSAKRGRIVPHSIEQLPVDQAEAEEVSAS